MDHNATYRKTEKGLEEIKTRAAGLPVKLRSVLILIDGKTSLAELLPRTPLAPDAYPQLDLLLESGLIEVAAPAPAAAPAAAGPDLKALQRQVCRALLNLLGPEADRLTIRIETAASLDELRAQTEQVRQAVVQSRGQRAADQFWREAGGAAI